MFLGFGIFCLISGDNLVDSEQMLEIQQKMALNWKDGVWWHYTVAKNSNQGLRTFNSILKWFLEGFPFEEIK